MNRLQMGSDFEFVIDEKDKSSVHIKILNGEYVDTLFKFGKVQVDEKDGNAYLQFDFDVISSPIKKVDKTREFRDYIGNILYSIIMDKLDLEGEEGYYDENRTDDTEEPNAERGVLS